MFSLKLTVAMAVVACCLFSLLLGTTCLARTTHAAADGLGAQRQSNGNLNGITFDDKARVAARRLTAANSKCCYSTICARLVIHGSSSQVVARQSGHIGSISCGPPCVVTSYSPYSWTGYWGTSSSCGTLFLGEPAPLGKIPKDCVRSLSNKYKPPNAPNLPNNGYNFCVCVFGDPERPLPRCTTQCVRPNVAKKLKDSTDIGQDLAAKLGITADISSRLKVRAYPGICIRDRAS